MTQMPQMVALFNGVGGGAAALVALLELHEITESSAAGHDAGWFTLAATAFTILVGSVSFAGSIITFAKLQDLMTSRPVIFPGLPVVFGAALDRVRRAGRADGRRAGHVASGSRWGCSASWSVSCSSCPSAGPTYRS